MDWSRIERRWYRLKGELKERWGHLTNDDHLVLKPVPVRAAKQSPTRRRPRWNDQSRRWNQVLFTELTARRRSDVAVPLP